MNVIMLGPQGSGKGTHSDILADKFDAVHISSGDLLREEAKKDTEKGKKVKKIMNKGELVPDDLMVSLIKNKIEDVDAKHVLLDGFPRNLTQAKKLEDMITVDKVILMDITDEESVNRLSTRRQCKKCGEIYSLLYKKPKKEGKCDKCGGELYQRDDDKPEAIKKRLKTYHEETEPLIDHFDSMDVLRRVDCDGPINVVEKRVEESFKN